MYGNGDTVVGAREKNLGRLKRSIRGHIPDGFVPLDVRALYGCWAQRENLVARSLGVAVEVHEDVHIVSVDETRGVVIGDRRDVPEALRFALDALAPHRSVVGAESVARNFDLRQEVRKVTSPLVLRHPQAFACGTLRQKSSPQEGGGGTGGRRVGAGTGPGEPLSGRASRTRIA